MRQSHCLRRNRLPILVTGLLVSVAQAQTGNDAVAQTLSIDPALCVLTSEQDHCTTPLHIRWQLPLSESTTICLYIAEHAQPLFCESGSKQAGERHLLLELSQNTEFELRRQHDLNVLGRATVVIARQLSDLRPRRRHGWGIF